MIVAEVSCSRAHTVYGRVSAPEPSPAEGRGPARACRAVPPRHGTRTGLADWIGSGDTSVAASMGLIVAWSQLFG